MTLSVDFQNITKAESMGFTDLGIPDFDRVSLRDAKGGVINLFLPHGTGQAIADAINAAVTPADEVTE